MTHQYQALIVDLPILIPLTKNQDPQQVLQQLASDVFGITSLTENPDVQWLNPEENLKIEVVRQLQELSSYKPYSSLVSLFILSNLETASQPAQQALLKILEEPPAHVRLVLLCGNLEGILPTILSRTQIWLSQGTRAEPPATSPAENFYQRLQNASYGALIGLADEVADRDQAQQLTQDLIVYLHQDLARRLGSEEQGLIVKQLRILTQLLDSLRQNLNLKLAVTETLFKLKQSQTRTFTF